MRLLAILWLALVAVAGVYLGLRLHDGVTFQTDLLALLPREEQDAATQRAKDQVAGVFSRRIVLLVGHTDREKARRAGGNLAQALTDSGMVASVTHGVAEDGLRRLGQAFFPYRSGLLSSADRERLEAGHGDEIVKRALATVYGPMGFADAKLLKQDPFLLLPSFFATLPLPLSRIAPDDGVLSVRDGGTTYVLVSAQLTGQVYGLSFQQDFVGFLDGVERRLRAATPDLVVLRTGAVFYAHAAGVEALGESSALGTASLVGTAVLVLVIFRAIRPLLLSALAIAVGALCAYSASLWLFGEFHVGALLFGVSLIGIAVDYSLNYAAQQFSPDAADPSEQLRRVMPGVALGLATTLIGYVTLFLAPFPGLRQVAVFSSVGTTAAFVTVVLWAPSLDRRGVLTHGARTLAAMDRLWIFWQERRFGRARLALAGLIVALAAVGVTQFTIDDDVRRLQSLSPNLKRQEGEIQRLTSVGGGMQFFLVQASSTEAALRTEEALIDRLDAARRSGALAGLQAVSQFVPSMRRQEENRALVRDRLMHPFLAGYYEQLGLIDRPSADQDNDAGLLTLDLMGQSPVMSLLGALVIEAGVGVATHVALLSGVTRTDEMRRIGEALPGVQFVDPVADVTELLGAYRRRAVVLLAVSAALMVPLLAWRYGLRHGMHVTVPSSLAVLLAPPLVALGGGPFTFFNVMALVLVLSIGLDYSIFCRETDLERRRVTLLGVALAMSTTLLSFGILALSRVPAVHAFGLTMLVGIFLAFLFSPLAAGREHRAVKAR